LSGSNAEIQRAALELVTLLADAQSEVASALIDSQITSAVYCLALDWHSAEHRVRCLSLLFFSNLASGKLDLHRTLCINLGLPDLCLEQLAALLREPECTEEVLHLSQIISAALLHIIRQQAEWDLLLRAHSATWISAMQQFSAVDSNITTNLAFALADIASYVDKYSMHELVPIFTGSGLLSALMRCDYPEREVVLNMTACRLFCSTDDYVTQYLLSSEELMHALKQASSSIKAEIRMYAFNSIANLCGSRDSSVHELLQREGYFAKLVAVVHIDIHEVRKYAVFAVGNILNHAGESQRDWFCNQPLFLEDIVGLLDSKDAQVVEEACGIIQLILQHIQGNMRNLAWLTFAKNDLESKLNTLALAHKMGDISWTAGQILSEFFDYEVVSEDADADFDGDSEGEEFSISRQSFLVPSVGQQPIATWLAAASERRYAEDAMAMDPIGSVSAHQSCIGGYQF
jgi:hypothetical protein